MVEEAESPEVEIVKAKEEEAPEEMKVSFGNARVIVSAPIREAKKPFVKRPDTKENTAPADGKTFERHVPQKSESAGKTFHTFSNTSFSK